MSDIAKSGLYFTDDTLYKYEQWAGTKAWGSGWFSVYKGEAAGWVHVVPSETDLDGMVPVTKAKAAEKKAEAEDLIAGK